MEKKEKSLDFKSKERVQQWFDELNFFLSKNFFFQYGKIFVEKIISENLVKSGKTDKIRAVRLNLNNSKPCFKFPFIKIL